MIPFLVKNGTIFVKSVRLFLKENIEKWYHIMVPFFTKMINSLYYVCFFGGKTLKNGTIWYHFLINGGSLIFSPDA